MPRACLQAGVVADHFFGASRHDPEVEPAEALMILVMSTPATALRQDRPGVTRVQAHHRQLKGTQLVHQRAAFQSDPLEQARSPASARSSRTTLHSSRARSPTAAHRRCTRCSWPARHPVRQRWARQLSLRGPAITPCLLRCLDCPVAIALLGTLYVRCECHQELDCRANPIRWTSSSLLGSGIAPLLYRHGPHGMFLSAMNASRCCLNSWLTINSVANPRNPLASHHV